MFLKCAHKPAGDLVCEYAVLDTEYMLVQDDKVVLADVNYDKTKEAVVMQHLQRLANDHAPHNHLPPLAGGYFIVLLDKVAQTITCYRDAAGIKSGFISVQQNAFFAGTQVHVLAKAAGVTSFDPMAVKMLLATEFLYDGFTIYDAVSEVVMGSTVVYNLAEMKLVQQSKDVIHLAREENTLTWDENVKQLRQRIVNVHEQLASTNNIVYLSGGIDSCVMLASLDEVVSRQNIHSISYRVKGTAQDETVYAKSLSKHLGTSLDVVEVDPAQKSTFDDFEQQVLRMNNPYLGMWIFPPLASDNRQTYFGGQDTRLHTPDVSKMDDFVFDCLLKLPNAVVGTSGAVMQLAHDGYARLNMYEHGNKYIRNLDRALNLFDPKQYLLNHFFKFNWRKLAHAYHIDLSKKEVQAIKDFFHIDFKKINNKRDLYNTIVARKWPEQYTDDIRYMQDMAAVNNTYMAMPFYDKELSEWSSGIPYNWGTKFELGKAGFGDETVKINKVLLRSAFRDKLNDEVYYRKKAVSVTGFLLFMGSLGNHIRKAITDDIQSGESFIKEYNLQRTADKYLHTQKWHLTDQPFLLRIYYIAVLCVYYKQIKD